MVCDSSVTEALVGGRPSFFKKFNFLAANRTDFSSLQKSDKNLAALHFAKKIVRHGNNFKSRKVEEETFCHFLAFLFVSFLVGPKWSVPAFA
jgi:hypothetical protein